VLEVQHWTSRETEVKNVHTGVITTAGNPMRDMGRPRNIANATSVSALLLPHDRSRGVALRFAFMAIPPKSTAGQHFSEGKGGKVTKEEHH
jgi:hypothetical protein